MLVKVLCNLGLSFLCAAVGLNAALSISASDSPFAHQLVISDARLTSRSCIRALGDVFLPTLVRGEASSRG